MLFKAGDKVRLRTGSPQFVVDRVDMVSGSVMVTCSWADDAGRLATRSWAETELRLSEAPSSELLAGEVQARDPGRRSGVNPSAVHEAKLNEVLRDAATDVEGRSNDDVNG